MNIGIMGGTFNPIHNAHCEFVKRFILQYQLDICYVIPAHISPFKIDQEIISDIHRLNLVKIALLDYPHVIVSDIEIQRQGISYTIDTINQIKSIHPNSSLFLLIGEDQARDFDKWREYKAIIDSANLVVIKRFEKNYQNISYPHLNDAKLYYLDAPMYSISSTEIREKVKNHQSISGEVPSNVEDYIYKHSLYL